MPFQLLLESAEDVDRIVIREDIKDGAKHLSRAEKAIGVVRYGLLLMQVMSFTMPLTLTMINDGRQGIVVHFFTSGCVVYFVLISITPCLCLALQKEHYCRI